MARKDVYLALDLGNSSTRVMVKYGLDDSGKKMNARIKQITNRYGYLTERELALMDKSDYNERNSKVFRCGDEIICIGDLATAELGSTTVKPTSIDKKYLSKYSKYAVRLALLQGMQDIAEMTGEDIETLDILWHVSVCLPAVDMQEGSVKMKSLIKSITEIDFLMPEITKKINIDPDVRVIAEGVSAAMGMFFESRTMYRYGMKDAARKKTFVIDSGEETTDISIIYNGKPIQSSLYSILMGGNTVSQKLKVSLAKANGGRNLSDQAVRDISITGKMHLGAREFDVSEEVIATRKEVARTICNEIKQTFNRLNMNVNEIEQILMCGGGALQDEDEIPCIGHYVKEELAEMLPYADFLDMPLVKTTIIMTDGSKTEKTEPINPRLLNVMGAGVVIEPKR